jgi:uncharacterized repeat protein (TIGR03803 family)
MLPFRLDRLEQRLLFSTFSSVASFLPSPQGSNSQSPLVMDSNGDLFGTTANGGAFGYGTIFEIAKGSSTVTTLHSFNLTDGANPYAGVTLDSKGNLYGTATLGGPSNEGVVYELTPGSGTLAILGSFNGADGADPYGGVILDSSGDLFGTTQYGGNSSVGTIWEIVSGSGSVTTLASFDTSNGARPYAGLVADSNGDFFGTTQFGGAGSDGTIFELQKNSTSIVTVASFNGTDGSDPQAPLILDSNDNLFGATTTGGANGKGTIFEQPAINNNINVLASFTTNSGSDPVGPLIESGGTFYGTASSGGSQNAGTVFVLNSGSSSITTLASLTSSIGQTPNGGVVMDTGGNLFGTAALGGAGGNGAVFELAKGKSTVTALASFPMGNGSDPNSGLTRDGNGNLFGITQSGGPLDEGTIFEIVSGSSTVTTLASVSGGGTNGLDPSGPLAVDSSGNVYGTMSSGGANSAGTVFEIAKGIGSITTLGSFNAATTGSDPSTGLVIDGSGNLFGTTSGGGSGSDGTIFEVVNGSKTITLVAAFNGTNGALPTAGLVVDANGNVFGTTSSGGANSLGTVFEILKGTNSITTLASFNSATGDDPQGPLTVDSNGNVYGTTSAGGPNSSTFGTIFEVLSGSGSITTLYGGTSFAAKNLTTGLVRDSAGDLFGSGIFGSGNAIFELPIGGVTVNNVQSFSTGGPVGTLVADGSGDLFGVTSTGGSANQGNVFEITSPAPAPVHLAFIQQPTGESVGTTISPAVTVAVENQNNSIITSDNSEITLALNSSSATLGGTLTVPVINGVASFGDLSVNTAGQYTLVATDGNDSSATSNSFSISTPSTVATKLVFGTVPTSGTAGSPLSLFTVMIESASGTVITSDNSEVTISVASGPGSASGELDMFAQNGVATFIDVSLSTAGLYTLKATDGKLAPATSTSINNGSASAPSGDQLVFTQEPSTTLAGLPTIDVSVAVEDQDGNILTGDNPAISIAANGPGSIGNFAGYTTVTAQNGVATFGFIFIDTTGTYTLTATDGTDTPATSTSFNITDAGASQIIFGTAPSQATVGSPITPALTFTLEDMFNNIALSDNSTVDLELGTGPAAPTGVLTATVVNGVATFNDVVLNAVGDYTLTAVDPTVYGFTTVAPVQATTSTIDAVAGVASTTATQLAFATQPPNAAVNANIGSFSVDVEDSTGAVVTTDNSAVTIEINSGPGDLNGNVTVNAVKGVATFTGLSLDTAGQYTFFASDGNLNSAISSQFTISQATDTATKLAFMQPPTNTAIGVAIAPAVTVAVEDSSGSVVTTDNSTVTIALASGPGTLGGTLTAVASNGIATFNNLTLNQLGQYELVATDGSLTSVTSGSFNVVNGISTQLVFDQQPTSTTVNGTITPPISVKVEDALGNVVQSSNVGVSLSILTGPAGAALGGTTTVTDSNGIATFTGLSLNEAGNYVLQATSGSKTAADSVQFSIGATATQLAFVQQPSAAAVGGVIAPPITVAVEDQNGNTVTSDTSTVTIALTTPNGATLGGTLTAQAVNGVATFSNLTVDTAGGYTLTATDSSLTAATSSNFNITPVNTTEPAIIQTINDPAVQLTGRWWYGHFEPNFYGNEFINDGNQLKGTKSAQFNFNLPASGTYDVSIWDPAGAQNATNVPVNIVTSTGTTTVTVNEQTNGGEWFDLGTYSFGQTGQVVVSTTGTNGFVVANAVKFTPVTLSSDPSAPLNFAAAPISPTTNRLSWTPLATDISDYLIQQSSDGKTWTTLGTAGPTQTQFTTAAPAAGQTVYYQIQAVGPAGSSTFVQSAPLTTSATDSIIQTINDPAVAFLGRWWFGNFQNGYYGSQFANNGNQGNPNQNVQFDVALPSSGSYDVQIWSPASPQNASNVHVDVLTSTGTSSVTANEQSGGWIDLGSFVFGSFGSIILHTDGANGLVVADAVKFTPTA